MLSTLMRIIKEDLPGLLLDSSQWNTMHVVYETPNVERLWLQLGDYRLNLHRIHPCERPLLHPHPWPSAVLICSGRYEMAVGYSDTDKVPPEAARVTLVQGSAYQMLDPHAWHSVRPLGGPSMSIMLTGKPFAKLPGRVHPGKGEKHMPLSDSVRQDILGLLRAGSGPGRPDDYLGTGICGGYTARCAEDSATDSGPCCWHT